MIRKLSNQLRKIILVIQLIILTNSFNKYIFYSNFNLVNAQSPKLEGDEALESLLPLENKCFDTLDVPEWWSYVWCYRMHVNQVNYDYKLKKVASMSRLGDFMEEESSVDHQIFRNIEADCLADSGEYLYRYVEVTLICCDGMEGHKPGSPQHNQQLKKQNELAFIESVVEPTPCSYYLRVCTNLICSNTKKYDISSKPSNQPPPLIVPIQNLNQNVFLQKKIKSKMELLKEKDKEKRKLKTNKIINNLAVSSSELKNRDNIKLAKQTNILTKGKQLELVEKVKEMFYHGYNSYMDNAFPFADLHPITCEGAHFELIKVPLVTLIDTLDTLVILGNYSEFRRAVKLVSFHYQSFDIDVNVSVFETTIRILGGLLSAHLLAIDTNIGIYSTNEVNVDDLYDNCLIDLAKDLGERLLPAFETNTRIPYGTVNLRHGVPIGETEIASTAGAGSLLVEFETLSSLTGDSRYGDAAYTATHALFIRRSSIGLLGKHINTNTGLWVESSSGIGSNSDSFYEYLLKSYLLFRKVELYQMFTDTYSAIKKFVQTGDWFSDVDMFNGKVRRNRVENLQAFWPGMESMLGYSDNSAKLLNSFYSVWTDLGFLPEEFDYVQWQNGKGPINSLYPLRPELIESTYHQYRATKDRSWLSAGEIILNSIEDNTRTDCGYATVSKLSPLELTDDMPSFFLSETCKYLYLLFDEDNFVHNRAYIFSTEAHLFDPMQLPKVNRTSDIFPPLIPTITTTTTDNNKKRKRKISDTPHTVGNIVDNIESKELLPIKCYKKLYWDIPSSFNINYGDFKLNSNSDLTRAELLEQKKIKDEVMIEFSNANAAKISHILKYTRFNTDSTTNLIDMNLHSFNVDKSNINNKKDLKNRKHNACYPEDEPIQASSSEEQTSNPSQTINVNMGPLGEFVVIVYADGFVVKSKSWGDTIEISNIGQSVAFVRDVNAISTKTIIGDIVNEIVTSCSVSIVTPSTVNPSSFSTKLWERSCSVANFGPKVIEPIEGELLLYEQDEELCTPIIKDTSSGNDLNAKKSWWQHLSILDLKSPTNKNKVKLSNDIVLAKRGGCMFEDKAMIAQKSGAAAVIVSNTEDFLFLMSGKKNIEELINSKSNEVLKDSLLKSSINDDIKNKIKSSIKDNLNKFNSKKNKEEDIEDNIKIPTVMITKADRENLIATIEEIKLKNKSKLKIKIELSSQPMILDSDFLGNNLYPKLKMQKNVIHVVGRGKWGAILSLTTGSEYQLFIMSKKEMNNVPFDAITSNNNPISINGLNTANPVESYKNYLTNKCSSDFSFDGNIMKIKPKDEIILKKHTLKNNLS